MVAVPRPVHTREAELAAAIAPIDAQETATAAPGGEGGRLVVRFRRNKVFVAEFFGHLIFRHRCHEAKQVLRGILARAFALGAEQFHIFRFADCSVETDEVEIFRALHRLKRYRLIRHE